MCWFSRIAVLITCVALAIGCTSSSGNGQPTPSSVVPDPQTTGLQEHSSVSQGTPPGISAKEGSRTRLVAFCAGSLILPLADLEADFEAEHPDIDLLNECHGSIQVIRHVTDLHEPIDQVMTADHALIPMLMYTVDEPETGKPYASWYIQFAGNKLGLAYTKGSRYADKINSDNWYEIITLPEVRLGIADPRFDASGYRALMALKLAERSYGKPDIFDNVIRESFQYPIFDFDEENYSEISVPEIVETTPDSGIMIRGSSIQLIALLESGDLDYAFEYESVIQQHGLELLPLPDDINLGVQEAAESYARVEVKINFRRFATVKPVFKGEPIGYALTIPVNAPHPDLAVYFIEYLLGQRGRAIMNANFHPVLDPVICSGAEKMPSRLNKYCQ